VIDVLDAVDVSENDLVLLATIYNECLAKIDPFRYNLKFTSDFKSKPWYKDLFCLYRLITILDAKPREYIQAQIAEYRPALKKGRKVPTIKMMVSPSGVQRYYDYLYKHDRAPLRQIDLDSFKVAAFKTSSHSAPKLPKVVKANTMEDAPSRLHRLMGVFHIETEQDFFKDPFLIKQLPREYVTTHPVYKELCANHYYEQTFGLHGLELIS